MVLLFSCFTSLQVHAQDKPDAIDSARLNIGQNDTVVINETEKPSKKDSVKRHSPRKAALFSAALPGLGQAYNRKYWKIPIIYAGFGGLGVAIYLNAKEHKTYSDAYRTLANDSSLLYLPIHGQNYTASQALDFKNYYKRNLDISIIFTAVLYVLNIVDATVDAHLFEYDISDKLTMRIQPVYQFQANGTHFGGVQLNFRL